MLERSSIFMLACCLCCWLLSPAPSKGEIRIFDHTVDQPFSGAQSPDNAYLAALTKAKFEVLELAGTYIESLSIVENATLTKDQVTALAGGILKTEVINKENYATAETFGMILTTRISVDAGMLQQRVEKLLSDRTLLEKYNEIQQREQELLARIRQLETMNKQYAAGGPGSPTFHSQFAEATVALTASEYVEKAIKLWSNGSFRDPQAAINFLDQAIKLDQDNPRSYNSRAVAYLNLNRCEDAERDLLQALQRKPDYSDAYNNLGSLYYRQGKYQLAVATYEKALTYEPELVDALLNRGMAFRKLFKFEEAFEDFRKVLILAPNRFNQTERAGGLVQLNDIEWMCRKARTACELGLCSSLNWLQDRNFCTQP